MIKVIIYQIFILILILLSFITLRIYDFPTWIADLELVVKCCLVSTLGGVLYCLRAVYVNKCVRNSWSADWEVWYFLRPLVSLICGVVSYVFLKAGLVLLDASQDVGQGIFGYLAFSFLAGLNVDKFVKKLEDIGKAVFGIELSRSSNNND